MTAAKEWVDRLESGWRRRDPAGIAAIFTDDARYYRGPFDPPHVGTEAIRAHWAATLARQTGAEIWIGNVTESGGEAVTEFWCVLRDPATGVPRTAAGLLRLRLAGDGRCAEFREYWQAVYEARQEPPPGWFR